MGATLPPTATSSAFVQGLRDLGYEEGRTIEIVYRGAEGREMRLPALAAELVRLPFEVILASRAVAARAAKDATGTIPIVIDASYEPERAPRRAALVEVAAGRRAASSRRGRE